MGDMVQPMTVSNSEMNSFQVCERQHYYYHGLGITPVAPSVHFERGILGHKAIETYYRAKIAGLSKKDCIAEARKIILIATAEYAQMALGDPYQAARFKMHKDLSVLIEKFADYYWDEPLKPIEIETVHKVPLTDTLTLGIRVDMLAEYTEFPYKGDLIVVDWKFRYNFLQPHMMDLGPQIPKYIWALQHDGFPVTKGMLVTIRYRDLISPNMADIFHKDILKPKPKTREQIVKEHIAIAERIYENKRLPVAEYANKAIRTLNEFTSCNYCPFTSICSVELRGEDPTILISSSFKPNDYGYDIEAGNEVA